MPSTPCGGLRRRANSRRPSPVEVFAVSGGYRKGSRREYNPPTNAWIDDAPAHGIRRAGSGAGEVRQRRRGQGVGERRLHDAVSFSHPHLRRPRLGVRQSRLVAQVPRADRLGGTADGLARFEQRRPPPISGRDRPLARLRARTAASRTATWRMPSRLTKSPSRRSNRARPIGRCVCRCWAKIE